MRVLELYCGIGGCAAALGDAAEVVQAVDINEKALAVYRLNFPHAARAQALDSISEDDLRRGDPELWWLSPPCQPFTTRGLKRDLEDRRAASFLRLLDLMERLVPHHVALENVPGFQGSQVHGRLISMLTRKGYRFRELLICPSDLGLPNRRRRYYLVASQSSLEARALSPQPSPRGEGAPTPKEPLREFLDPDPEPELWVDEKTVQAYGQAMDRVRADDVGALTACFTSAYGRSPVRSGSYLETDKGLRRFSPQEILRLLGYPPSFRLPPELPLALGWRLVGNSLSLPPVRLALSQIPDLLPEAA